MRRSARTGFVMRRYTKTAVLACVAAVLLGGCGNAPGSVGADTIVLEKGGGLTYYLVGDFGKDYYDLSELGAMAEEEADAFNGTAGEGSGRVSVERVELLENDPERVSVVYRFDGGGSFSGFTGKSFFYGTVQEAINLGYSLEGILESVEDGTVWTWEQILQGGKKMLVITDARAVLCFPSGVTHMSRGLSLAEDGSVDLSDAEETAYILLK